jgi:hypothetical protein
VGLLRTVLTNSKTNARQLRARQRG